MRKRTAYAMIALALPALVVSAQTQPKMPLRPLGGGSSANVGVGRGKAGDKDATEQKAEARKDDAGATAKIQFTGPPSGWGVTKAPTPYYTAEGKNLGVLPGGTLFRYSAVKSSSKSLVFEAEVKKQGEGWAGPFLLDSAGLALFEGKPDNVPPDTLSDLLEYYALKSKIAERKAEIEKTEHEKNPAFLSAKRAQEKYTQSTIEASELAAKAEQQKGPAKNKTDEQLRALKYEQVRMKAEADKEAANYKAWKETHPITPETFKADPALAALEKQLAPLKAKLGALTAEGK